MQKPLSVARNDYIESLCDLTNKSCLPAFIIQDVLERLLVEIKALAENELRKEKELWEKQMNDKAENKLPPTRGDD